MVASHVEYSTIEISQDKVNILVKYHVEVLHVSIHVLVFVILLCCYCSWTLEDV